MGVEHSILKKRNKNGGVIKFAKKNKNRNSDTLENQKIHILDNFKRENESIATKPQSKTIKTLNLNQQSLDETPNKSNLENLKNLKSFSVQNLVKIENNHHLEEADSFETNCCSNKSKEEITKSYDEMYNDVEDNNSFEAEDDEDEDQSEESEKSENETEEQKKEKERMVTNNMKAVFIESKTGLKEQNENANEENRISTLSMTSYDYELNFYRNGNDIRQSYFTKLVSTNVWTPNMKPKQHNSIIIFDWDDTLLPTSFLTPGGVFDENIKLREIDNEKLLNLERAVLKLLTEAVEKGNVYIITNAGNGWVEYSANRFYPSIMPILEKIKIISARGQYEKMFPGNSRQWKIEAFLNLLKNVNMKLVTNIICIGDSLFEMEAGRILASKFTEAFIKTIKFREAPKLDELLKQLKLVCVQFGTIYASVKNLTIRVERKKKDGI